MIALLYSDKHYDIIEKNKEIADEEVYVNTEDYYSEVSDELEKGKCYECENVGFVHKDTGICKRCYDISMHSLANFSKSEPRFIYGRCV